MMTTLQLLQSAGFVVIRTHPKVDVFVQLDVPPGHVIVMTFLHNEINCAYGKLMVFSLRRNEVSIQTEKLRLCKGQRGSREVYSAEPTVYGAGIEAVYLYYDTSWW